MVWFPFFILNFVLLDWAPSKSYMYVHLHSLSSFGKTRCSALVQIGGNIALRHCAPGWSLRLFLVSSGHFNNSGRTTFFTDTTACLWFVTGTVTT